MRNGALGPGEASLLVLGLSHKTSPLEQREKATLSEAETRALVRELTASEAVCEAVALSTCNRTEIYASSPDPARADVVVAGALVAHTAIAPEELACARYLLRDDRAAAQLFRVASGLDSMVVGESEIQGQVRAAWRIAAEEGSWSDPQPALPPGPAGGQARALGDADRRRLGVCRGGGRRPRGAGGGRSPGPSGARHRRRADGRGDRARPRSARRARGRGRESHHRRARAPAGGSGGAASGSIGSARSWRAPISSSPRRARHTRSCVPRRSPPSCPPAPTVRWRSSTSPCPAT